MCWGASQVEGSLIGFRELMQARGVLGEDFGWALCKARIKGPGCLSTHNPLALRNIWTPSQTALSENQPPDYPIYQKLNLKQPNAFQIWTAPSWLMRAILAVAIRSLGRGCVLSFTYLLFEILLILGDPFPT